ncbi:hypothetical protein J6590_045147 [Homalodisca vitripennis]|nr:hypothetical protein J6590_045147 [Homalodisca vitripennis]
MTLRQCLFTELISPGSSWRWEPRLAPPVANPVTTSLSAILERFVTMAIASGRPVGQGKMSRLYFSVVKVSNLKMGQTSFPNFHYTPVMRVSLFRFGYKRRDVSFENVNIYHWVTKTEERNYNSTRPSGYLTLLSGVTRRYQCKQAQDAWLLDGEADDGRCTCSERSLGGQRPTTLANLEHHDCWPRPPGPTSAASEDHAKVRGNRADLELRQNLHGLHLKVPRAVNRIDKDMMDSRGKCTLCSLLALGRAWVSKWMKPSA